MDIVKEHSELSIEEERVVMKKKIEHVGVFYAVKEEIERRGWKYIKPRQIGRTYGNRGSLRLTERLHNVQKGHSD